MKNPFYEAQPEQPDAEYEHAAARDRLVSYLRANKGAEEIPDAKLQRVHPDLADEDVYADVLEHLGAERPARSGSARRKSTRRA